MDNCTERNPSVAEKGQQAEAECRAVEPKEVADKITKRLPPGDFEAAEIKKARRRTKKRHPTIAMHQRTWATTGACSRLIRTTKAMGIGS